MKKLFLYSILLLNSTIAFSQWNQVGQTLTGARFSFGVSVSISGDGMRIATVDKTNDGFINVYEFQGTSWQLVGNPIGPLLISSASPLDLDYDGDRLVVSNIRLNPDSFDSCFSTFSFNGTDWEQLGNTYMCGDPTINDVETYGSDVKINDAGTRIMVFAHSVGNLGYLNPAYMQVFELVGNEWTLMGDPFIIGYEPSENRGFNMTMSADGSKIGYGVPAAPTFYNPDLFSVFGYELGIAIVYEWQENAWVFTSTGINSDAPANFGGSRGSGISFNGTGNRIAVGTLGDDTTMTNVGKVEVYEQNVSDGSWSLLGNKIYGEAIDHEIGRDVALNREGNVLAIGAAGADVDGNYSVKTYHLIGDTWTLVDAPIVFGDSTLPWGDTFYYSYNSFMEFSETGRLALAFPFGETEGRIQVFENPSLAVKESQSSSMQLYPNPFTDQLIVDLDNVSKGTWSIISVQGQQLLQGDFSSKQLQLNLSSIKRKGIYFLKVELSTGTITKKIIKA